MVFLPISLLPSILLYSGRPMIFRLGIPGKGTGGGLPSPGALQNPSSIGVGVSRGLSSQTVTGEVGTGSLFSNSGILESKML